MRTKRARWASTRLAEIVPRALNEATEVMRQIGPEDEAHALQALDAFTSAITRASATAQRRASAGSNRLVVGN